MPARRRVLIAGMGDTGVLASIGLSRRVDVVGVATKPALVSGQELGLRLSRPAAWRRNFLVPLDRFRRLDGVRTVHGRIEHVDLARKQAHVARADGGRAILAYDALVIATGTTNGFWRDDRVESLDETVRRMDRITDQLIAADTIAVVGGGPTGTSAAANLARGHPTKAVHLFFSGEEPLPGYHPRVRSRVARELVASGVRLHPGHRAVAPDGIGGEELTGDPVAWSTGQEPFEADAVLWAVGRVRPNTAFLPAELLDADGFVAVDEHLRSTVDPDVFAVGDVAATDPARSSARNWGFLLVARNVLAHLDARPERMRSFRPPRYRWGSILGTQEDGLLVFQPNGSAFKVPVWMVQPLLFDLYLRVGLYRGIRPPSGRRSGAVV